MNIDGKLKSKILPFALTIIVIMLDQITKMLVVRYIPVGTIANSFLGDFFNLIHVRNTGVAFSFGASWNPITRRVLFSLIPFVVLVGVIVIVVKSDDFTKLQRWSICGIIGGGYGNVIDRIFRPEGVVDFIDLKFFGIFGLERWPTFNVADAAVVVCGILLIISYLKIVYLEKNNKENKSKGKK